MANRICSCCGQGYTDKEGHDYEQCIRDCQRRIDEARHNLTDALDCWENAMSRRIAHRAKAERR